MLMLLFEHSFYSQYGTFLGDCERERESIKLHAKTTSLWSYSNRPDVLKSLLKPIYDPNPSVIWPSVAPISLEIWTGIYDVMWQWKNIFFIQCLYMYICLIYTELYLRWVIDQSQAKTMFNQIQTLVTHEKESRSRVSALSCMHRLIIIFIIL